MKLKHHQTKADMRVSARWPAVEMIRAHPDGQPPRSRHRDANSDIHHRRTDGVANTVAARCRKAGSAKTPPSSASMKSFGLPLQRLLRKYPGADRPAQVRCLPVPAIIPIHPIPPRPAPLFKCFSASPPPRPRYNTAWSGGIPDQDGDLSKSSDPAPPRNPTNLGNHPHRSAPPPSHNKPWPDPFMTTPSTLSATKRPCSIRTRRPSLFAGHDQPIGIFSSLGLGIRGKKSVASWPQMARKDFEMPAAIVGRAWHRPSC